MRYDNSDSDSSNITFNEDISKNKKQCKCGSLTHKRISFKGCPLNINQRIDTVNIAKTSNFSETSVQGSNITNFKLYIGKMNAVCYYCKALLFNNEKNNKKSTSIKIISNMCCFEGKVILPEKNQPSELIKNLLNQSEFQTNIRGYNSALSFTSLGINLDERYANNKTGIYTFRIHGSFYHRIGSLFPDKKKKPVCQQVLFHDTDNELDNRLLNFNGLDRKILSNIQNEMHLYNPYVKILKQFSTELIKEPSLSLVIKADNNIDRRVCNKPIVPEIAAILPGDEDSYETSKRDIVIETKSDKIKHIDQYNPAYDALQYVLPFMKGDLGNKYIYIFLFINVGNKNILQINYYLRLSIRN